MKYFLGAIVVAAMYAQTQLVVESQLKDQNGQAGQVLTVGPDGKSVSTEAIPLSMVYGRPDAPGCVLQANGAYQFPRVPKGAAVYRNGLRASAPGEFTLAGDRLTFSTPIPGELVLCDYTF